MRRRNTISRVSDNPIYRVHRSRSPAVRGALPPRNARVRRISVAIRGYFPHLYYYIITRRRFMRLTGGVDNILYARAAAAVAMNRRPRAI